MVHLIFWFWLVVKGGESGGKRSFAEDLMKIWREEKRGDRFGEPVKAIRGA